LNQQKINDPQKVDLVYKLNFSVFFNLFLSTKDGPEITHPLTQKMQNNKNPFCPST
jgi:hypothetical protein